MIDLDGWLYCRRIEQVRPLGSSFSRYFARRSADDEWHCAGAELAGRLPPRGSGVVGCLLCSFSLPKARWQLEQPPHGPRSLPSAKGAGASGVSDVGRSALRHRGVQLNVTLFFVYTGLEVAFGQWSFTMLVEARGIRAETAGAWVTVLPSAGWALL